MNKHLNVIFFGTPDYVIPILEVLNKDFNLIGVVTAPDAKVGRKGTLTASAVKQAISLKSSAISIFTPTQLSGQLVNELASLNPDLFIVASFGKIIPQAILDIPKHGAVNIHPSTLPKYRGPSPIQSQILDGVEDGGITFILMDEKMDHGPILFHEKFRFSQQDNFDTLSRSMFQKASKLISEVIIGHINSSIIPQPQDDTKATFCKMIKKDDGYFDIENLPAGRQAPLFYQKLDKMIRAYYPWPTAWTKWENKIVKFLPARNATPARIAASAADWHSVAGGPNQMIQMEGKNPVSLKDFLNGYPTFPIKQI